MSSENDKARHSELLAKLMDDQLSADEVQELSALLSKREIDYGDLVDDISTHAALAWHGLAPRPFSEEELLLIERKRDTPQSLRPAEANDPGAVRKGDFLRYRLLPLMATAAAVLVVFIGWWRFGNQEGELAKREGIAAESENLSTPTGSNLETIATLVDAVGSNALESLNSADDKHMFIDQTLEIESGLVELRFHAGANAVLRGPARLRILGPNEVMLDLGNLSVEMDEGKDGFIVKTPDGRIQDLGTSFGVSVSGQGSSEVSVFDGAVSVTGAGGSLAKQRVVAGQTVTMHRDGSLDAENRTTGSQDIGYSTISVPDHRIIAHKDSFIRGGSMDPFRKVSNFATEYGEHRNYGSEEDLQVKFDTADVCYNRRAWLGFDISSIPREEIIGARLTLTVLPNRIAEKKEPTNIDSDSDWLFEVSGLWDVFHRGWSENSITWQNAPGNASEVLSGSLTGPRAPTSLGKFRIRSRGRRGEKVQISGQELLDFLRADEEGEVTFIVSRLSGLIRGVNDDRVVHGFASREHPELDPPTLELWCSSRRDVETDTKEQK